MNKGVVNRPQHPRLALTVPSGQKFLAMDTSTFSNGLGFAGADHAGMQRLELSVVPGQNVSHVPAQYLAERRLGDPRVPCDLRLRPAPSYEVGDEIFCFHGRIPLRLFCQSYRNMQRGLNSDMSRRLETLGQRIRYARQKRGFSSQTQLAEAVGLKQPDISKLELGLMQKTTAIARLARVLRVPAVWLEEGEGPEPDWGDGPQKPLRNEAAQPYSTRNVREVWVVGKAQGGLPERVWDDGDYPAGATDEYAETASQDRHAFVCPVVGTSMIPKYTPGDYALVEPSIAPELEDDVLVRLKTGQTMLKRLLGRRGTIRLGSYNDPEVLSFDEDQITWMYYVPHPIPRRHIKHRTGYPIVSTEGSAQRRVGEQKLLSPLRKQAGAKRKRAGK